MKDSQVVIFNKNQISDLLAQFDFKISKVKISDNKSKEIVVNENNEPVHCECCEKEIRVNKVGSIVKGSRLIFCDNPTCLSTWTVLNKFE